MWMFLITWTLNETTNDALLLILTGFFPHGLFHLAAVFRIAYNLLSVNKNSSCAAFTPCRKECIYATQHSEGLQQFAFQAAE